MSLALFEPKFYGFDQNFISMLSSLKEYANKSTDDKVYVGLLNNLTKYFIANNPSIRHVNNITINNLYAKYSNKVFRIFQSTFHTTTFLNSFTISSPLMLGDFEGQGREDNRVIDISKHDVNLYRDLVIEGTLYDRMKKIYQDELGLTFKSRREVKNQFFAVLYGDLYEDYKTGKTYKKFKEHFPTVCGLFELLKKEGYPLPSCILQNMEADIFLNRICKRIHAECPETVLFVLHDGIAFTAENEEFVKGIMQEEITKAIGYVPSIDREDWQPENLPLQMVSKLAA